MVQPEHRDKDQIHSDKRLSALPQVILLSVKQLHFYSTFVLLTPLCFFTVIFLTYCSKIPFSFYGKAELALGNKSGFEGVKADNLRSKALTRNFEQATFVFPNVEVPKGYHNNKD